MSLLSTHVTRTSSLSSAEKKNMYTYKYDLLYLYKMQSLLDKTFDFLQETPTVSWNAIILYMWF